jgi:hypothetical protein
MNITNAKEKTYLTTDQTAKVVGVMPRTVRSWKNRGVGPPHIQVGGIIRYLRSDIDDWLLAHRSAQ